ncbi:MAG: protoporphyrinogen/coproporphyrinogen oxidase [Pseudonocardiales bacterium]|jgi:oxygen-dependent protoporphyrinogen oxidase|nr:protoporphyrinogen/coproporphyrinogen oxidase [Pseudonocardiales bacterium]
MTRLVVIGGGISGLSAAWAASAQGFDVLVVEGSPRVGGKLRVEEVGGIPVDVGAEALLTARPEGIAVVDEVGLGEERISPLTTSAQVRAGGRSHPLPARTMMGIPSDLEAARASGALTESGLAAVAAEPSLPPMEPLTEDVAVGALVRSRVGDEVADRLVEPLLGGVYAGRADDLSLRATMGKLATRLAEGGSLVDAARAVTDVGTRDPAAGPIFTSVRGGLGRLPTALVSAGRFEVRTSTTVRSIRRTPAGFALECGAVPVAELIEADAVIVAVPPAKAARLLRDVAAAASSELAGIESASMAIVSFAFDGVTLPPGSGLLVGAGERLAVKAITLSSQKWPLAADGLTLLRASVGRIGEPLALQIDDQELITLVRHELRPLLGVEAAPVDAVVTRWGGGLPQYAVGHLERIGRVRAAVAAVPGLAVCGAAFDGVGVPACIGSAYAAVARVVASLPERGQ